MKKILFAMVMALVSATTIADVNTNSQSGSQAGAISGLNLDQSAKNSGNVTNNGSDLSKGIGYAAAPALTTTLTETCMGSTSVGGGFSGGSFSFGTTWRDSACVRRLDAREIKTFGDAQAAKEIMCDSDLVREAFKRVGRPCAEDGGIYTVATAPAPTPVVEQAPVVEAPATDAVVRDDQDEIAKRTQAILDQMEQANSARNF